MIRSIFGNPRLGVLLLTLLCMGQAQAQNIVVKDAWRQMLLLVYGAVVLLCFVTFRSWRAVVVAVLPLVLTSFLAEALMVALGMGVKVATLPVIALGVGIGVDYALYILSIAFLLVVLLVDPDKRKFSAFGLLIVALGIPVYLLWRRADKA